jgi:hypothetical protein
MPSSLTLTVDRMRYSTYLGADSSDARDDTYGLALDPKGLIVVTGRTQSAGFPMVEPPVPTIYNSAPYLEAGTAGDEPYLVKIDPSLEGKASLVYSTFLGGRSPDKKWGSFCSRAAVDLKGMAYVGGETMAPGIEYTLSSDPAEAPSLYPYTKDALLPALHAILMQITPDGTTLAYSTFFGGKKSDRAYGLAVDPSGNIFFTLPPQRSAPLRSADRCRWPQFCRAVLIGSKGFCTGQLVWQFPEMFQRIDRNTLVHPIFMGAGIDEPKVVELECFHRTVN